MTNPPPEQDGDQNLLPRPLQREDSLADTTSHTPTEHIQPRQGESVGLQGDSTSR
jgi:hypothetical protein